MPTPLPSVVCVCTGNICRSPAMELYLARAWGDDAVVTSAGTVGVVGFHPPSPMREVLRTREIDASDHVARQLEPHDIRAAHLVLVAGHHHLTWVLRHHKAPAPHVFLLTEAAALAARAPRPVSLSRAERIRSAATLLDGSRTRRAADYSDIADPYGHGQEAYERAMDDIVKGLDALIAWVG